MSLLNLILLATTFLASTARTASAALKNTSSEFHLKTQLKPKQPGKSRFDNLWVETYHTGAGFSDVVLFPKQSSAVMGFLNGTNGKSGDVTYQNVVFDLESEFPWSLVMAINTNFYAAWEPAQINAGGGESAPDGDSGFWFNETGLQWTTNPHKAPDFQYNNFGGWLVCSWWHGVPQLFFRVSYYDDPAPCSCADVNLIPEYL